MSDWTASPASAVGFALMSWWLGTGLILWLVRLPRASFAWSLGLLSLLFLAGLWAARQSMQGLGTGPAFLGFASAILMWSWHELAFLTGWLTGPRRTALSPGARGLQRFRQALAVVSHHELALLANFALLVWLQQGRPNHVALCTFALLWCMRFTAKMNLFLGVPEVGEQYLPAHLAHLGSYFRRRPVTPFFHATLGGAGLAWLWLIWEAHTGLVATTPGWVLLATLLGLAIVEHVLMVFPVPMQRLWGWAMSRGQALPATALVVPVSPAEVDRA